MAVTAIERMGHIALASPHGRHAYEALKLNDGIELVITDIMMPEMDGRQLIRIIREDAEFADLPIIAMSSVVGSEDVSSILELGATLFMPTTRITFLGPKAMAVTRLPIPSRLTSRPSRVMALVLAIITSAVSPDAWVPGLPHMTIRADKDQSGLFPAMRQLLPRAPCPRRSSTLSERRLHPLGSCR